MQLTNICRDVLEDARMGRVYLPRRRLVDAGASPDELLLTPGSEPSAQLRRGVTRVVGELLAEAEQSYRQGQAGFRYLPVRARLAVGVAAQLYRAIGRRLLGAHGGDPLHGRTVVPAWQKLLFTLRATAEWLASALGRRVQPSDSAAATASLGS
jgi:phytoene synthase